jgi:NAD-dependent SIR2 family protein deacetylase
MKGYPVFRAARPNPAHTYLVQLERSGRVSGLITQNVDRLHQQAGHKVVVDLHGRLDEVICLECGQISPRNDWQHWLIEHNPQLVQTQFQAAPDGDAEIELRDVSDVVVPHCLTCNGIVKPNVVFYGASVAPEVVAHGYAMVEQADAMLVVGSSLMVYSSFRFVRAAYERGIPVVAINLGTTRADDMLTAKVQLDCATALAQIQGD